MSVNRYFEIVTDSSCDLAKDLREKYEIADLYIRGLIVASDGREFQADLDWNNTTPEEYFGSMKSKKNLMKTAMPSISYIEGVIESYLKQGKDVLCVTLSSGISGTYNGCRSAAESLKERYPNAKILCVDSKRYSTAEGLLCVKASQLRAEGKSIEETYAWLEENKNTVHQMGMLDDLFFCNRMGRVSGVAAVMGTFVGIKPMADFGYHDGVSLVLGKVRGYKAGYETILNYMEKTIVQPEKQVIFIGHSLREAQAKILRDMVEERFHPSALHICTIGQSCGTSVGPGLIAAYYFGDPISKDNIREKVIMQEILANG